MRAELPAVGIQHRSAFVRFSVSLALCLWCGLGAGEAGENAATPLVTPDEAAAALVAYFEMMSVPQPFPMLTGAALETRQRTLRARIMEDISLSPLPERVDLDIRRSVPVDHPWCTIEKVEYQLWPGVYTKALLLMPREFRDRPAPAVLCPHGHWDHGYAHPDVQKRLVVLARMGYVVLSPRQNHHEELTLGLSHQTLMVWTSMRGIDLLQALPEVDPERIGAAGASGGGLQTQMIAALDRRVKAATIVGLTCDYREVLFPHAAHCGCNHWPNAMVHADWPEMSALAFPNPVQYLVMNDWTRHFPQDNFPAIVELYRENGLSDRVSCTYWPTPHTYDREKRERTYWWMERWLRGGGDYQVPIPAEPGDIETVSPPESLADRPVANPANKGFAALTTHFRQQYHHARAGLPDSAGWTAQRERMRVALPGLLGLDRALPPEGEGVHIIDAVIERGVRVSRVWFASEGGLRLPALTLSPAADRGAGCSLTLCLSGEGAPGKEVPPALLERAAAGEMLVLPCIRFTGTYDLLALAGVVGPKLVKHPIANDMAAYKTPEDQRKYLLWAWERNSIVWGRPLVGMAVTDIQHVLRALSPGNGVDMRSVRIEARGPAYLSLAAVFAAILDPRIQSLDLDFRNRRYEDYRYWHEVRDGLPVIPFILRHGDVPQWLAGLADRRVSVNNLNATSAEMEWLHTAFAAAGDADGLRLDETE